MFRYIGAATFLYLVAKKIQVWTGRMVVAQPDLLETPAFTPLASGRLSIPQKKAVRFDGLLFRMYTAYLTFSPSHKEASLQTAIFSNSSSISWSLDSS